VYSPRAKNALLRQRCRLLLRGALSSRWHMHQDQGRLLLQEGRKIRWRAADAVFGSVLLCLTDTDFHIVIPTRSSRFPPPTSFWNAALSVSWARRKRIAMSTAMHLVPSSPRPISAWIQKVKLRLYFRTLWLYYRGNGFRFRANEFWSFVCSIHFLFDGHVCVCCR